MKSNYEEKIEARKEAYSKLIEKNENQSKEIVNCFGEENTGIPMGQPILVGHHSERRHRKTLERAENKAKKCIEAGEKAQYYKDKLEALENNNAISSDDSNALEKLKSKLENLEEQRETIKQYNKQAKKEGKFPLESWRLTNLGQNIRSVKKRIQKLELIESQENREHKFENCLVVENYEENRLQVFFDEIPEVEARDKLKRYGFKWAKSIGAWQRFIQPNNNFYLRIIKEL